jgi:hypothetical protein
MSVSNFDPLQFGFDVAKAFIPIKNCLYQFLQNFTLIFKNVGFIHFFGLILRRKKQFSQ